MAKLSKAEKLVNEQMLALLEKRGAIETWQPQNQFRLKRGALRLV